MLNVFGIPRDALPKVVDSSGVVGMCSETILGRKIPIAGIAGDQHARAVRTVLLVRAWRKIHSARAALC